MDNKETRFNLFFHCFVNLSRIAFIPQKEGYDKIEIEDIFLEKPRQELEKKNHEFHFSF
jgi:hypothetical protein